MSALIILVWYPYVSLFPDLLCKFGLSVSGLRKIRFNAYTLSRISTKKSVQSALIILDWGNLDLLYNRKRLNVKRPEI